MILSQLIDRTVRLHLVYFLFYTCQHSALSFRAASVFLILKLAVFSSKLLLLNLQLFEDVLQVSQVAIILLLVSHAFLDSALPVLLREMVLLISAFSLVS